MITKIEEALTFLEAIHGGAFAAFKGEGPSIEWGPESCAEANTWYDWCDDCNTFHKNWYVFGYGVTEGEVEVIVWCIDQDGNWEVVESAYLETPMYDEVVAPYCHEEWERSYARYLRHVAETGDDPCEEFMPPAPTRKDEEWEVHVIERGEKVWVTKAGMLGGAVYEQPDKLPSYVQEFLLLEKLGEVSACAIDPENVKGIADLGEEVKWKAGKHRDTWFTTVTISRYIPSMTDDEWSAVLREKANKARAELAFSDS